MSWRDGLYALLAADATLSAAFATRMAPMRNKQADGYPRLTWQEIAGLPENSLAGWSGTDNVRLQMDVWDSDHDRALQLKDRIRVVMAQTNSAFTSLCITDDDGPVEDGLEIYRRMLEFSLWTL